MSLDRIKEILEKMKPQQMNEAVKLSPQDVSRLMNQSSAIRSKLMQTMGDFDVSSQQHTSAYNNFFKKDDGEHKPEVDMGFDDEQMVGDEKFQQLYSGVENVEDVAEFFNALYTAMHSVKESSFRFRDVKVRRNGKIYMALEYVSDTEFKTERNEFEVKVAPGAAGTCKVVSIDMKHMLFRFQPTWVQKMYDTLNKDPRTLNVLKGPINTGDVAEFK